MAKSKKAPAPGRPEKPEKPVVIGERIRELMEAKGWSQMELAWRSNLGVGKINRAIMERQGLSAAALLRIVIALATSSDYLFGLTDDPKPRRPA